VPALDQTRLAVEVLRHHLLEPAVLDLDAHALADERPHRLDGILGNDRLLRERQDVGHARLDDGDDEVALGREVAEHRAVADSRAASDLRHLAVDALGGEQLLRRGDDRLAVAPGIGALLRDGAHRRGVSGGCAAYAGTIAPSWTLMCATSLRRSQSAISSTPASMKPEP